MVAVIDATAECRVKIGTATPAGLRRGFVYHDADSGLTQLNGGGETGKPGTDDVNQLRAGHIRP